MESNTSDIVWARVTAAARSMLSLAASAPATESHQGVTEEVLLSAILESGKVGARILRSLGVEAQLEQFKKRTERQTHFPATGLNLSDEVREVLSAAFEEADRIGDRFVGEEHILAGISKGLTPVGIMLRGLHVNPDSIRSTVVHLYGEKHS